MRTSLSDESLKDTIAHLEKANAEFARRFPGESGRRQPVHTVYGGAQLFKSDTTRRLGALALRSLEEYGPDPVTFARAIELPGADGAGVGDSIQGEGKSARLAETIYTRVLEKLRREPVEDFRIDFEDGYGNRPDEEEDGHAVAAAREVVAGMRAETISPFIGIRIKPFTEELRARSMRTLDIFITTLVEQSGGALPSNFVVTLPKVTMPEQVTALADIFDLLEKALKLEEGALKMELMIETTQAIINHDGQSNLPRLLEAARGRCTAAHFGTYDYTASCQITAAHQHMMHPACDFARHMMQVALGGTGVWLSDGATNIMPVGPHRAPQGSSLTEEQREENRRTVHRAWKLHYDDVRHSLASGFYQGWDLHPAQLVTRYTAVYAFFLEGIEAAAARLRNFLAKAAQATLIGDVFDDAATGQGLLNFFLRGINSGALSEAEAAAMIDLTAEELRTRSFTKILAGRRA
jgi:citrate lyase beta subunit